MRNPCCEKSPKKIVAMGLSQTLGPWLVDLWWILYGSSLKDDIDNTGESPRLIKQLLRPEVAPVTENRLSSRAAGELGILKKCPYSWEE